MKHSKINNRIFLKEDVVEVEEEDSIILNLVECKGMVLHLLMVVMVCHNLMAMEDVEDMQVHHKEEDLVHLVSPVVVHHQLQLIHLILGTEKSL